MNLPANQTGRDPARRVTGDRGELPVDTATRVEATLLLGEERGPQPGPVRQFIAGVVQLLLVMALLAGAYMAWNTIIASAPTAERGARERVARMVETVTAEATTTGPQIRAWGEVVASQTLIVRPEIAGRLEWVHPDVAPGGLLIAGTEVARIDDRDLSLAVLQARADIAEIEARIQIEEGQAAIGARDLTRLSRNISDLQKSLVLREPQMAQLEAELAAARAVLEQAENALARTRVVVPFDALVIEESVAPGTMLTVGMEAAVLMAADRFEVVLRVPEAVLGWVAMDGSQRVVLTQPGVWPEGAEREGRVIRLGAGLSESGRMAELIVAVDDPLARLPESAGKPRLLLGSFVQGRIEGAPVETASGAPAVRLDRAYLRDANTVWVMNPEDQLEVRTVEIAWRGAEHVLVTDGISPGERIVTTTLATFAEGMSLRTRGEGG